MIGQNFLKTNSLMKRLTILCAIGALGWAVTNCGDSSGGGDDCEDTLIEYDYDGDGEQEEVCAAECDGNDDCSDDRSCEQGYCVPSGDSSGSSGSGSGSGSATGPDGGTTGGDDGGSGSGSATATGGDDGGSTTGDDDGGSCTNPGNATCERVATCASLCGGADNPEQCAQSCEDEGTCDARTQYTDYEDCVVNNCGMGSEPTCQYDECEQQLDSCGLVGSASCDQVRNCDTACQIVAGEAADGEQLQAYEDCVVDNCENGTIDAQKSEAEVLSCLDSNGCFEDDAEPGCNWENCASQLDACGQVGSSSCRDIQLCSFPGAGASHSDYLSYIECFFSGTEQAQLERTAINSCTENNCSELTGICDSDRSTACSQDSDCPDSGSCVENDTTQGVAQAKCSIQNCDTERSSCGIRGDSNQTCGEIFSCQDNCSMGDSTCTTECVFDGSQTAQADRMDLFACAAVDCPNFGQQCFTGTIAGTCSGSGGGTFCDPSLPPEDNQCADGETCDPGPCTEEAETCEFFQ